MMVVLVALSVSVTLTYAFLQTQAVAVQISANGEHRDLALQAAQTGAAVAMQQMQSPSWSGVSTTSSGTLGSAAGGTLSYSIEYLPDTTASDALTRALRVLVRVTGLWTSSLEAAQVVQRQVELHMQLQPRAPGRAIVTGDSASAVDVAPNPGNYDQLQAHALALTDTGTALTLEPGERIDGTMWLRGDIRLFQDPEWDSPVRRSFLSDAGDRFVSGSGSSRAWWHPHPFGGALTFRSSPSSATQDDLSRLRANWSTSSWTPAVPAVSTSSWKKYRLYEGGFEYSAAAVSSTLQNVTLRPSLSNPLGIFYRNGSVNIGDDVTIEGTLVAENRVTISGENVHLGCTNFRDSTGELRLANADLWPRLPAIVANELVIDAEAAVTIDGAVTLQNGVTGAGATYELVSALDLTLTGAATSRPLRAPLSEVQLPGSLSLLLLSGDCRYSIWFQNGTSGQWYPIESVDAVNRRLTIWGEVRHDSPTSFKIHRTRQSFADIRGPVLARSCHLNGPREWKLNRSGWNTLHSRWQQTNLLLLLQLSSPVNFTTFLEAPSAFFLLFYSPYTHTTYGLSLEPTFHLSHPGEVHYRFEPPLFAPYQGTGNLAGYAGYRWKLLSWRELP